MQRKMTIEIRNETPAFHESFVSTIDLPTLPLALRDAEQRARLPRDPDPPPEIVVISCPDLPELIDCRLDSPSTEEMNFLASRMEQLTDMLFSLIADFCHYMLESINCAAKMNVAVSYALLRKPLKDTLGYIEWLYADRKEVLDLLIHGKPEDLQITKEKAKKHTAVVEQEHGGNSFFSFRYDKSSESSLEHIWNNANHLITTKYKISRTEPGNLNFVFADEPILRRFSDYYYLTVPAIMMYATNLICDMFEEFVPLNKYTVMMNKLNRMLRSMMVFSDNPIEQARSLYSDSGVPIVCPRCGLKMKMTDRRMYKYLSGKYRCVRCLNSINTGRYIFDWEKITFTFDEDPSSIS